MKYRSFFEKIWYINKQCKESKKEVDYNYPMKQKLIFTDPKERVTGRKNN